MFESLTSILPRLGNGPFATVPEQTGDGSPENPYVMLHFIYSDAVKDFIHESLRFVREHEEMNLYDYEEILCSAGVNGEGDVLKRADVSSLDGKAVMAMIMAVISAEKFCDGVVLQFCEAGCIKRWLKRLKEIDESGEEVVSIQGRAPGVELLPDGPYPIPVRDLVRGEVSAAYIMQGEEEILDIDYGDYEYKVSAEDLLAGIRNMKGDLLVAEQWINELLFCDDDIWPEEEEDEGSGRLLREESAVLCARKILDEERYNEDEESDGLAKCLSEAETVLQVELRIGGDPSQAAEYPDAMLHWIVASDDEDSIDQRNTRRQNTFVRCLNELCRRGDIRAITKRGYCFYCGTKPYPQNWEAARDAFIYIYEKTGEAWPANTLGYIYYYGRCNGGVPEYGEAFRWFSIGHAGGMEESTYKLGDLFANGFGVVKNGGTAFYLYYGVYKETLDILLGGALGGKFADAAIRMGNCYRDGIGVSPDPEKAYGYYLQARMALKKRMEIGSYFGDGNVKARLDDTMAKMREVYTDRAKTMRTEAPVWLDWLLDRDHRASRMTWEAREDGKITLHFTRVPDSFNGTDWILATFPAGDYCDLLRTVTVKTEKNAELSICNDVDFVVFDDYNWFGADNRLELLRSGELVAEIRTKGYRFAPETGKAGKKTVDPDKFTWKKGDLEVVKIVYQGKEVNYLPQEKQPLRVPPIHKRKLKEYNDIFEFQEDYPTKKEREKFVGKLRNYEIDELIEKCDNIQGKIYYDNLKKKEKVFEFSRRFVLRPFDECRLTVYDGPGAEKYAEYGEGLPEMNGTEKVRIGRKEIRAIQAAIEDNVLFETEYMERPYQIDILDGTEYRFFFAVKGRGNEMYGNNIAHCRDDYDHCMHSAHAIRAQEEIRDILVPAGVPERYFEL